MGLVSRLSDDLNVIEYAAATRESSELRFVSGICWGYGYDEAAHEHCQLIRWYVCSLLCCYWSKGYRLIPIYQSIAKVQLNVPVLVLQVLPIEFFLERWSWCRSEAIPPTALSRITFLKQLVYAKIIDDVPSLVAGMIVHLTFIFSRIEGTSHAQVFFYIHGVVWL